MAAKFEGFVILADMRTGSNALEERLNDFAENIVQRRLERLEGVAQVSIHGLRSPELQVNLDPARLRAHGLDVRQLVTRLFFKNDPAVSPEIEDLAIVLEEIRRGQSKIWVGGYEFVLAPG